MVIIHVKVNHIKLIAYYLNNIQIIYYMKNITLLWNVHVYRIILIIYLWL